MLNTLKRKQLMLVRKYTVKAKRSVLLQDKSKILTYEPKITTDDKIRVYVWGFQETGALGLQTSVKKATERYTQVVHHPSRLQLAENADVTDVAAGYGFSVFAVKRKDGETLFGTGINTDSQLGKQANRHGSTTKDLDVVIYPTSIRLPRRTNETDDDIQVKCMAAGRAHLVVITKNGTIFTLGNNSYGQCGRTIIKQEQYKGSDVVHRIEQNSFVPDGDEVDSVKCGQDHTMFLTKLGRVYTCGWGDDGQTGKGNFETTSEISLVRGDIAEEKIVKLACASDCVLALNDKGEVFGWGNSEYGQLDDSDNAASQINSPRALKLTKGMGKIKDIAAGGTFCMVLNEEGLVYTWGYGILGFGPYVEHSSKPQQLLPPLFGRNDFSDKAYVVSINCGVFHMGAVNSDGDLYMWGKNRFGCLGLGHQQDQFFPFKVALNGKVQKVAFGVDHTLAICKPFF